MRNQITDRVRTFFRIGLIKSIIVNFKLLPIKQAIRLPIIVMRPTVLESLSGRVILETPAHFGLIKVGTFNTAFYSWNGDKCLLNINGTIRFNGDVQFGVGIKICVDENAILEIGGNACIGPNTKIICRKHIQLGDNIRLAWEGQVFDTNFHYIKNIEDGSVYCREKEIIIGKNNWFGNRCTIMPGTKTNDYFIAASNSLCNKDYTETVPSYSLVAGSPAKLLKKNVVRVMDKEECEISEEFKRQDADVLFVDPKPRSR